ncbi:unnamed protein product [Dovyalis caffra]|uniref:valine--tRNA ligase n=1 Tax=Dovyalis caffra TaxID=77055 RepID=A0AAV1S0M4_9ROSI|nr:unnamed protein product [Dovyalis caffra]
MMLQITLSSPFLLSSCSSAHRLNPLLFSKRRRCPIKLSHFRFNLLSKTRFFKVAAAATENGVFTSPEIAKSFDFSSEERIYNWWESQGFFKPTFDRGSDPFVVSMPPPNVTGSLHMGHAMFVTLEDIMVRYNRMKGRPTLWLPGTDHAGIATQLVVEKMLASEGIKRTDLSRDEFTKRVWEWKEKYGGSITNQIKRLGASCDWTREHFTLDEQLSQAVIEAFIRLHEKGLIYQGSYLVNWSPNLQTAVSDLEVEYSEEPGTLYHIKYRVAGQSDFLTVATTRPETLFGDVAIAVNPKDDRYSKFIGKMAIVPMTYGRHVPIIADRHVDKDFGTGVLKISPGHDHNDYYLARKLGLPILNVMNKDGTLNDVAGLYCGLDRFEARKKLWSELEETGLAVKKEPYTLRVPRSQRGGEIIEPLVSKQWFVTMEPLAEKALRAVEKGELTIMPERFDKIYNHWLSNIKDWCISRQLWWGHRIPVWYIVGKDCEEDYIVARNADEALEKACEKYGKNVKIYQDPDVLDTWFSSALWPFSTLGWPDVSAEDFKKFYPTTMLETGEHEEMRIAWLGSRRELEIASFITGLVTILTPSILGCGIAATIQHDILFFWVARMVMMGIEFTGTVPFSYVYLHGLIRDSQGRKMSKTLGNVIDPLDTIKEFGTDALRFTISLGTAGQDLNLSTERLTANKAFTNKLWNAGKFVLQNLPSQTDVSAWEAIMDYKLLQWFNNSFTLVRYIEASKARLYQSGTGSASSVAQAALPERKEALIVSPWPPTSLPQFPNSIKKFENFKALTRAIRNARAEYSVEPAKRISASIVASEEVIQYISVSALHFLNLSCRKGNMVGIHLTISSHAVYTCVIATSFFHCNLQMFSLGDANQSVHLVASEGLEAYLPLADMVDISAEVERLSKRLSKMQVEYDGLVARLGSRKFVEKAPEDIVRGVREKAAEAEEKINLTKNRLAFLKSSVMVSQ